MLTFLAHKFYFSEAVFYPQMRRNLKRGKILAIALRIFQEQIKEPTEQVQLFSMQLAHSKQWSMS